MCTSSKTVFICCAMMPFAASVVFATIILLSPNTGCTGTIYKDRYNGTRANQTTTLCNCTLTAVYTWGATPHTGVLQCVYAPTCAEFPNTRVTQTIYVSYVDPSTWALEKFADFKLAIVMYIIGFIFFVFIVSISILSSQSSPSRIQPQPQPPPPSPSSDPDPPQPKSFTIDIPERGESILPKLAIGVPSPNATNHTNAVIIEQP